MLTDRLDYVIGVDPHRDTHALAIVDVRTGGVVLETSVSADSVAIGARSTLRASRRLDEERSRSRERAPSVSV